MAASFGPIPFDNRRILVTEWMAEGITHISIGHPATASHRAMPVARRASSVLSAS